MDGTVTFGQYLKRLRKEQDLTQAALAERANCSVDTVKKIEAGALRPSRQLAALLAEALDIEQSASGSFIRLSRAPLLPRDPAPPGRAGSPSVASNGTVPDRAGLVFPPTSFVGREQELEAAMALLARGDVQLLTLTGPGGVGKTRLAMHIAIECVSRFRNGVFFVNLASISDPDLVPSCIARAIGVQEGEDQPLLDKIKSFLRSRHVLLILDNFE